MNYVDFFGELRRSDSRIEYSVMKQERETNDAPMFYRFIDPISVEFEYNDGIVRLMPFDALQKSKDQYPYVEEGCIFATCNGEPIYEKNNKVYTCVCGKNKIIEEEIAMSIDSMFKQVNEDL